MVKSQSNLCIFCKRKLSVHTSVDALKASMYDIIQRAKIRKKFSDSGKRHDKALFGGFRKWFETTLNNIDGMNANVTEKLMGHRNDLRGVYYNPNIAVRFENFKKAIHELTIGEKFRLREENRNKDEKIKKLESKEHEIEKLKIRLDCIERLSEIVSVSKNS